MAGIRPTYKVLYRKEHRCNDMFIQLRYYNVSVWAEVCRWSWMELHWTTIYKYRPKFECTFDGDYSTRTALKMSLKLCVMDCKNWLHNGNPIK